MDEQQEKSQWAIVELMGHKVVAGRVSTSEMFGKPLLRVDVPQNDEFQAYTQFFGSDSIYCLTFVSEDVALVTAAQIKANPVSVYVPDLIPAEIHKAKLEHVREFYELRLQRLRKQLPDGVNSVSDDESPF